MASATWPPIQPNLGIGGNSLWTARAAARKDAVPPGARGRIAGRRPHRNRAGKTSRLFFGRLPVCPLGSEFLLRFCLSSYSDFADLWQDPAGRNWLFYIDLRHAHLLRALRGTLPPQHRSGSASFRSPRLDKKLTAWLDEDTFVLRRCRSCAMVVADSYVPFVSSGGELCASPSSLTN